MTEHMDTDEYRHYLKTGHMPRRDHTQPPECGTCDGKRLVPDTLSPPNGPSKYTLDMPCPDCPERTVTEVKTGRHHRKMVKRPDVGVTFASLTEERRFDWLEAQPEVVWVDVHPVFRLPHGLRYHADFLVHLNIDMEPDERVEDVKSKRSLTTDFKRMKRIFDDAHPFGPLVVVQWKGGKWVETR